MRITGSASPRNVGGKIKGAADTILGTGTDTADVVCDTRLAECFDLSPEKLKGMEQEQRKQYLKQEEKRIVL